MNNNKYKTGSANLSSPNGNTPILADMAEVGITIDSIFKNLETETDSFTSKIINGFHTASDFFEQALKLLGSLGGKNDSGDLLGSILDFIPGGGFIGGIINLFSGIGGMVPDMGGMNTGSEPVINTPPEQNHNITVIVNSEIESAKAVKFLNNYMPVYNTRLNERTA